jgi:acetyl-CoA carboxylase biotin carboxyl carrier protein
VDLQEIRKIVQLMNEHGLTHFDLTKKDFHLKLKKGADLDDFRSLLAAMPTAAAAPAAAPAATPAEPAAPSVPAAEGSEITSPMVGTYYLRPAPDAPPFVEVGSSVSVGQVICIIEAMKVMNEIKAETRGIITEVLVDNAKPVEYGQPMFKVRPL